MSNLLQWRWRFHWSSHSVMKKASQPASLSADTSLRPGYRCRAPLKMMWLSGSSAAKKRNTMLATMVPGCGVIDMPRGMLRPMARWKCSGASSSWAAAHNAFVFRIGEQLVGIGGQDAAAMAFLHDRRSSAIATSIPSSTGSIASATMRCGLAPAKSSASQSLYARKQASRSSRSLMVGRPSAQPGIHHAGVDAVAVLILEMFDRIVIARQQIRKAAVPLSRVFLEGFAGQRAESEGQWRASLARSIPRRRRRSRRSFGSGFAQMRRQPVAETVGRFVDVGIAGNHFVVHGRTPSGLKAWPCPEFKLAQAAAFTSLNPRVARFSAKSEAEGRAVLVSRSASCGNKSASPDAALRTHGECAPSRRFQQRWHGLVDKRN